MKKLFSTVIDPAIANIWLLILRLAVGGFMLTHGIPKLQKLLGGGEIQFADPFGIGPTASLAMSVFAEFFCSILIILGLGTRIAASFLIINMLVAVLFAHSDDPFSAMEKALLFLLIYITLLAFGGGRYSVDYIITGNHNKLS